MKQKTRFKNFKTLVINIGPKKSISVSL